MPASTLSGRSVALLRVRLDDCTPSEGQLISHGNCARSIFCRHRMGQEDVHSDSVGTLKSNAGGCDT